MRPLSSNSNENATHDSQSSRENATPSSGTSIPISLLKGSTPHRKVKEVIDENIEHYNKCSKREPCGTPLLVDELSFDGGLQKHEA